MKNITYRKVAQIAFIYGLALMAATACGEAFPLKALNKTNIDPTPFAADQSLQAKKSAPTKDGVCDTNVQLAFNDASRPVTLMICNKSATGGQSTCTTE